jgi:hypothetical protein
MKTYKSMEACEAYAPRIAPPRHHREQSEQMRMRSADNPLCSSFRNLLLSRFCGAVQEYLAKSWQGA